MSDDTIKLRPGYRKTREEEQLLRQFTSIDGPKGANEAYRKGWEVAFGKKPEEATACTHDADALCDMCRCCTVCATGCMCE